MIATLFTLGKLALSVILILVFTFILMCSAFYLFLKDKYKYWEELGIAGPKPEMFFGSFKEAFLLKCTEPQALNKYSESFSSEKYLGIYQFWKPALLVKDLELIRKILEKDFIHFGNRPENNSRESTDSVLNSLFSMQDEIWKTRRTYFSKLFTPSKLKDYTKVMTGGLSSLLEVLHTHEKNSEHLDLFKVLQDFSAYSFASGMYGLDMLQYKDSADVMSYLISSFMEPSMSSVIKFLCYGMYPKFFKFIGLTTVDKRYWDVASKFADKLFSNRLKSGQARTDLVSMVMGLMSEGSSNAYRITYGEAVGHIYTFLLAGTHPVLTNMSYVLFVLAQYQEVQEKVRAEIEEVMNGSNEITYDKIHRMTYLGNVITETNRVYPQMGMLKRRCTKAYTIEDKLIVPEGMDIYIDVIHINMNPELFPKPEEFKPERWENGEADPCANLSFGIGPRICVGKRFAEIAIKVLVTAIISQYLLLPSERMEELKFDPKKLFITSFPLNKMLIKLKKI